MISAEQLAGVLAGCPRGARIIVAADAIGSSFSDMESMDVFITSEVVIIWPGVLRVDVPRIGPDQLDD